MSTRSIARPSVKNCHASSRLVEPSTMPLASAARSQTQRKNSWVRDCRRMLPIHAEASEDDSAIYGTNCQCWLMSPVSVCCTIAAELDVELSCTPITLPLRTLTNFE